MMWATFNLPYYNSEDGLRYAIKDDGTSATLDEFIELYEQYKQTPEQVTKLQIGGEAEQHQLTGWPTMPTDIGKEQNIRGRS